jgi:hypothetical protein
MGRKRRYRRPLVGRLHAGWVFTISLFFSDWSISVNLNLLKLIPIIL